MEVHAPWPKHLPEGRLLDKEHRHLTLAFLGATDYSKIEKALLEFPQPFFKVGFAGKFDQCLFLPLRHPHVVAWHVEWLEKNSELTHFYEMLIKWLQEKGFSPDCRHGFMPHVTLCRSPFKEREWSKKFSPLPLFVQHIHLYESVGQLKYEPVWSYPLLAPFEEIEHMADIAYQVRGESFDQLYHHGALALAFEFPPLLPYLRTKEGLTGLDAVIMELNQLVAEADQEIGTPFKAVSFHSHLEIEDHVMHWRMIIDV